MTSFRSRSYNISRKGERKMSSSAVEGGSGFITENSSESMSRNFVESSNGTDLGVNNREFQEPDDSEATLLVSKKLNDQGAALGDELVHNTLSDTAQMDVKYQDKEPGKGSEDPESDEEKISEKQPEKPDDWNEDGNADSATSKNLLLNVEENIENDHASLKLSGSHDEEEDDSTESPSEDNSNNFSTPKVKTSLNEDHLMEENSYTEREIYETQLVHLQQQLVETMIKEQEASEKLKKLENLKLDVLLQELEEEKAKTSELTDKLEFIRNKAKNSGLRRSNASRRANRRSRNLENNVNQKESLSGEAGDRTSDDNQQEKPTDATLLPKDDTLVFNFDEGHFAVAPDSTEQEGNTVTFSRFAVLQEYKKMIVDVIVDRLWDFVNEDPDTMKKKDGDGDALSVITLKENINRCKTGAQAIARFVQPIIDVFTWSSPVASVMTFLVYMFAVIHGFLLPLIILMAILQLSSNYFYASGLADRFRLHWKDEPPSPDDKTLTDRFQLVLQVAKKVQIVLGEVADSLEKMKNLLNWQHPATNTLFMVLCLALVATSLVDGPTLFMIAGVGLGIKLFIVRPIYTKFPKVKKRYDGLARLWSELPTDADLAKQEKKEFYFSADTENAQPSPKSPKLDSPKFMTSWLDLCVRMKIPLTEYPLPSWEEGHRCTLMTKDKPLTKMKQGKLFLTQNYLCFERYKFGISKHVVIKLEDIVNAEKYKPMNIMPGTGKSMKIEIRGSCKPYIFGALFTRDELFESLLASCKAAKVPWACERKY